MNEANTMADIIGQHETVEQEIQRKGLTAPRVTPADLEANITSEHFFTAADGVTGREFCSEYPITQAVPALKLLTICVLVLRNGYTVHGVSACASPENFNAELGQRIARENAVREMWPLMGYALRERLHDAAEAARIAGPGAVTFLPAAKASNDLTLGFCGFLTADIPELHGVHPEVLAKSWERFKARVANGFEGLHFEHHENGDGR